MLPLSVFIIAKNEADRIGDTIRAVRHLTDDLLVVDSGSTDGTQEVSEALGARVVFNPWPGYGPQKRFAEGNAGMSGSSTSTPTRSCRPTSPARSRRCLRKASRRGMPTVSVSLRSFRARSAPHPLAYALAPVRLYRKDRGRYSPSLVHDRVDLSPGATVGRLKGIVHHRSVRSLGDQIDKLNRYSDQQAVDLDLRRVSIPTWRVYFELPAAFLKAYFGRRHLLRGTYGFLTAMNYAISRHMRLAKHYERRRLEAARRNGGGEEREGK